MWQLFYLVVASLGLLFLRSSAFTTELCQQDSTWRYNVCVYINNCFTSTDILLQFVAKLPRNVEEVDFKFREPQNVSSMTDFYPEMKEYVTALSSCNRALESYMATPEYKQESLILEISRNASSCSRRLNSSRVNIEQLVTYLSSEGTENSQLVAMTTIDTPTNKNLNQIYGETYDVTRKLKPVLEVWSKKCATCASGRRRRRSVMTQIRSDVL